MISEHISDLIMYVMPEFQDGRPVSCNLAKSITHEHEEERATHIIDIFSSNRNENRLAVK